MKQCPNCRNEIPDEASFCPVCGTAINAFHSFPEPYPPQNQQYIPTPQPYIPAAPKVNPYDHSSKYQQEDISQNKLYCMLCYLLDFIGIIIALLGAKGSEYARFHIHQAMKFSVLEAVLGLLAVILCWTVVIPILAAVALIILLVLKFVAFINVCKGKAIEPGIIRSIKFLK